MVVTITRRPWRWSVVGILSLLFVQFILVSPAPAQQPRDELFAADGSTGKDAWLYKVDPATGAKTQTIGNIGFSVSGLAFDPTTGVLYGSTSNQDSTNPGYLIRIDLNTGRGTLIGDINGACETGVPDITFTTDGTLYGWDRRCTDRLLRIDKTTGAGTPIGPQYFGSGHGLSADPDTNLLWHTPDGANGEYFTIDPATGARTSEGTLEGGGSGRLNSLAWTCDGETLFGTRSYFFGSGADLVTIDTATDEVTERGQTDPQQDALAWGCGTAPPPPAAKCKGVAATIVGTSGDDVITGTKNRDVIAGLGGKDRIVGLKGDDLICAGAGGDKVSGSGGNDRIFGQGGKDNLRGGKGNDKLNGGGGKDRCHGGPGRDKARKCERELQIP